MKKQIFRISSDGFNGAWYPAPADSKRGMIIMLGDSSEDRMAKTGAKWLNQVEDRNNNDFSGYLPFPDTDRAARVSAMRPLPSGFRAGRSCSMGRWRCRRAV